MLLYFLPYQCPELSTLYCLPSRKKILAGPGGVLIYIQDRGVQATFWVKNLSESYFLGQPIIQLLFWVHEMPNHFSGLEFESSLRNREKCGLHKTYSFFTHCR